MTSAHFSEVPTNYEVCLTMYGLTLVQSAESFLFAQTSQSTFWLVDPQPSGLMIYFKTNLYVQVHYV